MNRLHAFFGSVWNFKKTPTPQQDAVANNADARTRTRLHPAAGRSRIATLAEGDASRASKQGEAPVRSDAATLVQQMQTQQLKAEVQRLKTALAEANSQGTQVTAGHPAYIHTCIDTTCIYIHLYIIYIWYRCGRVYRWARRRRRCRPSLYSLTAPETETLPLYYSPLILICVLILLCVSSYWKIRRPGQDADAEARGGGAAAIREVAVLGQLSANAETIRRHGIDGKI